MSPLNNKRTTSSLEPPIFYVAKIWQQKDRRPITQFFFEKYLLSLNVAVSGGHKEDERQSLFKKG